MLMDPYASGVLDEAQHARLVQDIARYAKDAGIQPRWIASRMGDVCSPKELEYARKLNTHRAGGQIDGLCYFQETTKADPLAHMNAMAGALVRNFVRARVMTLGTVFDHLAKGGKVEASLLLIPNFCLSKDEGGSIAPWQAQAMIDLLLQRSADGQQTVLYATDIAAVKAMYGLLLARTIET